MSAVPKLTLSAAERAVIDIFRGPNGLLTRRERDHLSSGVLAFPIGTASVKCKIARTASDKRSFEHLAEIIEIGCGNRELSAGLATRIIQAFIDAPGGPAERILFGIPAGITFIDKQIAYIDQQAAHINRRLSPKQYKLRDAAIDKAVSDTDELDTEINSIDIEIARLQTAPYSELSSDEAYRENRLIIRKRKLLGEMHRRLTAMPLPPVGLTPRKQRTIVEVKARRKVLRDARGVLVRLQRKLSNAKAVL